MKVLDKIFFEDLDSFISIFFAMDEKELSFDTGDDGYSSYRFMSRKAVISLFCTESIRYIIESHLKADIRL